MDEKSSLKPLKRVHYFHGKLLSEEDFTGEQEYLLEKFRRHNRYLHGCGIVTGLKISISGDLSAGFKVVVSPGYAIDALGREIVVPALHEEAVAFAGKAVYVCLHYAERKTDPVPVIGEAESSAHSRIEESFEIKFEADGTSPADGIPLARLKHKKDRWKIDKNFRRPRIKN